MADSGADAGMDGMDMNAMMNMLGGKGGAGGDEGAGGMDMSAMMEMLQGMKGGGKGGAGMGGGGGGGKGGKDSGKDDSEKAGDDGKWFWQQKGSEEIHVRVPQDAAISKKDIEVKFKRTSLLVKVKGEVVIEGTLGGAVEVDECTWCIAPGGLELQVMLTKQEEGEWSSLLK